MRKKIKKSLLVLSACAASVVAVAVCTNYTNFSSLFAKAEPSSEHTVTLNSANRLTDDEKSAKTFTRLTNSGNPIVFKTFGGNSFRPVDNNFAFAADSNAWFYNETELNGLESMNFHCSNVNVGIKVFFFNEPVNSSRSNWVSNSGVLMGQQDYVVNIPRYENPVKYVVWQQLEGGNNWLQYFNFTYSCSGELEYRGVFFDENGKGVDITPTPVSTGEVTCDIKWTDLGADNGKVAIQLMEKDWSKGFGYKTVKQSSSTGDIPGLYVSYLSDGYTRYTWKLSEMTGGEPSEIGLVHVRADWTTSKGYLDVNSSASVVEYRGKRFTSGKNFDFRYDSVTLADHIMQVDIKFDEGTTTSQKANFYVCNDSSTSQSYGNYGLYIDRVIDNPSGVTFEILDSGVRRYTFNFSECTKGTATKPTESIYSFFRGVWTDANGIVSYSFIEK